MLKKILTIKIPKWPRSVYARVILIYIGLNNINSCYYFADICYKLFFALFTNQCSKYISLGVKMTIKNALNIAKNYMCVRCRKELITTSHIALSDICCMMHM